MAAFCSDFCAASSGRRATSIWVREARALASRASARSTCAEAESRDCVTCCCCRSGAGPLLLEPGEACVLQLGQRQARPAPPSLRRGPRRCPSRPRPGSASATPRPWPGRPRRRRASAGRSRSGSAPPCGPAPGRHAGGPARPGPSRAGPATTLTLSRYGIGSISARTCPWLDAVVLIDQEPDDPAGDQLRGDVDDVGLDEGVVGDRVGAPVLDPAHHGRQADGDEPRRATASARRRPGRNRLRRPAGGPDAVVAAAWVVAARRSLGRLDGAHGLLRMLRLRLG